MIRWLKNRFIKNELREMDLEAFREWLVGVGKSEAGIAVNTKSAMEYQPAAAAILAVSELLSILPLKVCQRRRREGIDEDVALQWEIVQLNDHPLNAVLGPQGVPNSWQDTQEFFELGTRQRLTYGNFLAVKNVVRGQLRELVYIRPKSWDVEQNSDLSLVYTVTFEGGASRTFSQDEVFHLRGPLDDWGYCGLNRVKMAKENIGLGIAQDTHAAKMFAQGTVLSGWFQHPNSLSSDAQTRLKDQLASLYGSVQKHFKVGILEEGMQFQQSSMNAEESQLMESRNLQRSVAAGNWHVPPHMVGDLSKATFSNIESQALQFVVFTLMRSTEGWEKAITRQLLTRRERREGIFVKFDENALLRGDMQARAAFYDSMRKNNAMSPNEIRFAEGWEPQPDGDSYENPNVTPGETDGSETEDTGDDAQAGVVSLKRVV